MPTNDGRIRAIQERLAQTTSGPWCAGDDESTLHRGSIYSSDARGSIVARCSGFQYTRRPQAEIDANAAFIAHARDDIPYLLEELGRLSAEQTRLKEVLRRILAGPAGCPFCDSGKLRNPQKDHDEDCGFALAATLVASEIPNMADRDTGADSEQASPSAWRE